MKMIKTQSNEVKIIMSKQEWNQIGAASGWIKKAENIDITRQKADTDKLFKALTEMRGNIGALMQANDAATIDPIKLRLQETLNDLSENNFVVKLDGEIGLDVNSLKAALDSNNFDAFNKRLESYFKPNLDESKAQLDRLMQNQKGEAQGVPVGLEQVVEDTGDSNS